MKQLLNNPKLQAACPLPFDEATLWKSQSGPELKDQIQKQFRNIRFFSDCFYLTQLFKSWLEHCLCLLVFLVFE